MTSQESATILLLDHQASRAARMRQAGIRENDLAAYYAAERNKGVDVLTANLRMHEHAKFLDRQALVTEIMESKS